MATLGTFTTGQVLTAAELNAIGTWTTFTPSWTNFTPGSATQDFAYSIVNKLMFVRGKLTLNGSTMGTSPRFTIPASKTAATESWTTCVLADAGTETYTGLAIASSTLIVFSNQLVNANYPLLRDITATTPMTWANSDRIEFTIGFGTT
jgi:hypothetical protein